jgi:lipopolysaccharide biosynthesis regulator YciM
MAVAGAAESRSHEAAAKASAPPKQGKQEKDDDATCRRKVDDFERRAGTDDDYAPTPEEELAIGKCYQTLDNVADARKWLQRAAAHRKTKGRAEAALRELAAE